MLIGCGSSTPAMRTSGSEASGQRFVPTRAPPLPDDQAAAVPPAAFQEAELYTGRVHLEVDVVPETVDAVTAYFEDSGAQIVSVDPALIVARVRPDDYEAAMRGLVLYGEVVERRSRAQEIAAEHATLGARRKAALVARKQLEAVLGTAGDASARSRLLEKIAEVTAELESLTAQVAALEPLLAQATIHVVLS
jgi:hypothetical protein